tara:strand:+ start:34 stop:435 length:402 start_codon:yes stop_codon:yes gene_type:complete
MNLSKDYADFIQQFQWNYFATCRTPYRIYTMTVRNWLTRLLNRSNKVEQAFYVTERDKGDYNNQNVHMLIGTKKNLVLSGVSKLKIVLSFKSGLSVFMKSTAKSSMLLLSNCENVKCVKIIRQIKIDFFTLID